nr:response regulator transcription factor [uncultured Pseudodesulfovibrio sp.]
MSLSASILIVDDHPAVREGLALLLAKGEHTVCGEAACRTELLAQLDSVCPDLVLVDISLGEESGLDCIEDLVSMNLPGLIYSMHGSSQLVKRALNRGARGFVTKCETSTVLQEAIQTVLGGSIYLSPRVSTNLETDDDIADDSAPHPQFSERERQALTLLAQGETYADIASEFDVSIRTVETYFNRMLIKLELDGMKALRKYAFREYGPI